MGTSLIVVRTVLNTCVTNLLEFVRDFLTNYVLCTGLCTFATAVLCIISRCLVWPVLPFVHSCPRNLGCYKYMSCYQQENITKDDSKNLSIVKQREEMAVTNLKCNMVTDVHYVQEEGPVSFLSLWIADVRTGDAKPLIGPPQFGLNTIFES
jgi:hypothetical protein